MVEIRRKAPFITIQSQLAWSCPWYSVRQDTLLLPDGSTGTYHVVQHPGAVWVIPVTRDGEIALLRHYRHTVNDWCWEVPAGGIKEGQSLDEAARAELAEEVGGRAEHLDYFGKFYTANGICNEVAHVFIASGVTIGDTNHEPAEVIEVHRKPITEVLAMAKANEISDGPSALALLLCEEPLLALDVDETVAHDGANNRS